MKVAIVGASGFVGSTLTERLLSQEGVEVVPFIHSSGNAWRLARLAIPLTSVNLLDATAVIRALTGVTHVVNCSRGGNDVMFKGLRNLLDACRRTNVQRFVHLSSVAVYGDPPGPDSENEDGRTEPEAATYGAMKLEQDRMITKAAGEGLSSIALCPPNISGAHSGYLELILNALRRGEFAYLDGGGTPCNMVDVCNLAHAITLALTAGPADGRRLFITDDHPTTWREVVDGLRPLAGMDIEVPEVSREELRLRAQPPCEPRPSVVKSMMRLVSSDVREALRKDPLLAKVELAARNSVRVLGKGVEDRIRLAVTGPVSVARVRRERPLNIRLCAQQLRGVTHSCNRAREQLGYRPLYTLEQSIAAFRRCYAALHGWDSPAGEFLRAL